MRMSQYTTRVELHDADWSDYTKLHEEMRKRGFRQTITSDDGSVYELPPAEYNFEGAATRSEVLSKARQAAAAVKRSFAILVTESAGRSWFGLKLLKAAAA
jgi:hypothetical protein